MAVKNVSENASTIKDMYELLPSDNWQIDRCLYYCIYENAGIVQLDLLFDKYYHYFEQYISEIDLDEKYYYCPQRFAEDYYGDAGLDFLVLYFANMSSNFEFNRPKIKVLQYAKLKEINQLFTQFKKEIDSSKKNPPSYASSDIQTTKTSAQYINKNK